MAKESVTKGTAPHTIFFIEESYGYHRDACIYALNNQIYEIRNQMTQHPCCCLYVHILTNRKKNTKIMINKLL